MLLWFSSHVTYETVWINIYEVQNNVFNNVYAVSSSGVSFRCFDSVLISIFTFSSIRCVKRFRNDWKKLDSDRWLPFPILAQRDSYHCKCIRAILSHCKLLRVWPSNHLEFDLYPVLHSSIWILVWAMQFFALAIIVVYPHPATVFRNVYPRTCLMDLIESVGWFSVFLLI